jgi:signal transduction histidine kinase
MALSLDAFAASGIVWIRPEFRREVHWGGDPDKPVQMELDASGQPKLSPRSSFARWATIVKGRSRPWTDLDIETARALLVLRQVLTVRDSLAQLRLSDRHFRSLVVLQSDAYCQLDPQGRVVTLSKPLPAGRAPPEGRTLTALFAPFCDDGEITALDHAIASGKPFRGLRLHGRKVVDQDEFVVQLGGEAMKNHHGRITGWHGTITDVTHEVAVQTALRQMEAAEMSNVAKSKFLSQMSHELRTPLNAVLGFSQLLLMDPTATREQRGNLEHIRRAGDWLLVMISDLMDLSMIETGNLSVKLEAVDARVVLDETIAMLGSVAMTGAVRLIPAVGTAPVWVRADGSRLKQVLVNLTSNALKYNRTHGDVRFTLGPGTAHGTTRIQVHDTGVGLTQAQIEQLFQPFNRLGRENLGIQGTGIGLVIAKQLIEAMGGRISVESEPGRGSIFGLTLADAQAPVAAGAPVVGSPAEGPSDRVVLYVEGAAANVLLVASIVESLPGVRLVSAESTARGLELARSLLPAVVLIDIGPDGTPGTELLSAIKAEPALRHIRCIAVNADAAGGRTLKDLQVAGYEDRWTEPIDLKSIWSGLNAALAD